MGDAVLLCNALVIAEFSHLARELASSARASALMLKAGPTFYLLCL